MLTLHLLSRRSWVVGGLMLLPVLVYVVLGGYAMWVSGLTFWAWLLLPGCWLLAWGVTRGWPQPTVESLETVTAGEHWTDRDRAALAIVRQRQVAVQEHSPQQLIDPHFYLDQVQLLAQDLATHYFPTAPNPYAALKVTEVIAAVHLAVEDLEMLTTETLPVAQWLTIGQWQALGQTPKWYQRVQESVWLSSMVYNPLNVLRYLTSKATVEPLGQQVQQELLVRLYMKFIDQVGFYLIEMNSGRLRGGTRKYRQFFGHRGPVEAGQSTSPANATATVAAAAAAPAETPLEPEPVRLVLVGQVSSGKSSLINALLGEQLAATDVLPSTRQVQRYALKWPAANAQVELLDTPGYGEAGASQEQRQQIETALQRADAVLLVMSANTAARKPDQALLEQLERFYAQHPELRFPPVIGVLTHVDLLKPAMIWQPPYDWQHPADAKGRQMQAALNYVHSVLGSRVSALLPVCTAADPARQWGVKEVLLPALAGSLREAQTTSLLRLFEKSLDPRSWRQTVHDLKQTGLALFRYWQNQ